MDDLFFPAKLNLAIVHSQQGRNAEAEALLRSILDAYPENGEAAYMLGLLLVELGQTEEALALLEMAGTATPPNPRALYNLGLLRQSLGRMDQAEAALRAALELRPADLGFLYALADHYVKRGRYLEALELAERMIAAHPDQQVGHQMKTELQRALGR